MPRQLSANLFLSSTSRKWRQDCVAQLRDHLQLENDIIHVMEQVMDGSKGDKDQETFVKKLLEDPSLTEPELIPEVSTRMFLKKKINISLANPSNILKLVFHLP